MGKEAIMVKDKLPKGLYIGEYMVIFPERQSQYYRFGKYFPEQSNPQLNVAHEKYYFELDSAKFKWHELLLMGLFGWIVLESLTVISSLLASVPVPWTSYLSIALCYCMYQVTCFVNYRKECNQVIFCRKTNKIIRVSTTVPQLNYKVDYSEFDAYCVKSPVGQANYQLYLINRVNNLVVDIADFKSYRTAWIQWVLLQQFMDPSQPLPDTPEFEACRESDEVTRKFDKTHGRDRYFWRNLSETELAQHYRMAFGRLNHHGEDLLSYPFCFLAGEKPQ